MATNDLVPPAPGDAHLLPGERALAEALKRERRRVRRMQALWPLLVLALAGAAAMALLWRSAVAEAERQRDLAQLAADRLADERGRALAAQAGAERARADAEAARRQVEAAQYAHAIYLAQQASSAQDIHRARELLEGIPPEPRGWEWHYLSRWPAPPPGAKE
jgi:hypothetical protein